MWRVPNGRKGNPGLSRRTPRRPSRHPRRPRRPSRHPRRPRRSPRRLRPRSPRRLRPRSPRRLRPRSPRRLRPRSPRRLRPRSPRRLRPRSPRRLRPRSPRRLRPRSPRRLRPTVAPTPAPTVAPTPTPELVQSRHIRPGPAHGARRQRGHRHRGRQRHVPGEPGQQPGLELALDRRPVRKPHQPGDGPCRDDGRDLRRRRGRYLRRHHLRGRGARPTWDGFVWQNGTPTGCRAGQGPARASLCSAGMPAWPRRTTSRACRHPPSARSPGPTSAATPCTALGRLAGGARHYPRRPLITVDDPNGYVTAGFHFYHSDASPIRMSTTSRSGIPT